LESKELLYEDVLQNNILDALSCFSVADMQRQLTEAQKRGFRANEVTYDILINTFGKGVTDIFII
jgi:hypothetical protein